MKNIEYSVPNNKIFYKNFCSNDNANDVFDFKILNY